MSCMIKHIYILKKYPHFYFKIMFYVNSTQIDTNQGCVTYTLLHSFLGFDISQKICTRRVLFWKTLKITRLDMRVWVKTNKNCASSSQDSKDNDDDKQREDLKILNTANKSVNLFHNERVMQRLFKGHTYLLH